MMTLYKNRSHLELLLPLHAFPIILYIIKEFLFVSTELHTLNIDYGLKSLSSLLHCSYSNTSGLHP